MMSEARQRVAAMVVAAMVVMAAIGTGCSGVVKDRELPFTPDPVGEAKAILRGYASGQPVGSESVVFGRLVARVSAVDPAKGAELREFFDGVAKRGANKAKAKSLLDSW